MYARLLVSIDRSATTRLATDEVAQVTGFCGAAGSLVKVIEELGNASGFGQSSVYLSESYPLFLWNGQKILGRANDELVTLAMDAETVLLKNEGVNVSELIAVKSTLRKADIFVPARQCRHGIDRLLLRDNRKQVARVASMPITRVRSRASETNMRTGRQSEAGNDV